MPTQSLMMNPMLATLSPDDQQSLLQLQQRQAIGQALLQQGLQPIDTSNRQVGGMGYRISPLEGLAKMAQMYTGNKISMDSMGKQAQLMGQMYGNAFGTTQPQQAPQQAAVDAGGMTGDQSGQGVISSPVPSGAQLGAAMGGGPQAAPQVAMPNGALTLPGKTPQQSMMLFSMLGPEGYARVLSQWGAPTDATRMAMAAGMPVGPANADALFRATYVAPVTGTGAFRDPRTMRPVAYNPEIPAGTNPLYDASGNVAKVQPIDGAQAAMQGNAAATAAGGAQFKPVQVYNPQTQQMEYSNEAAVTNPGTPAPLRNNNPGAVSHNGSVDKYPDMQTGIKAMDDNLASYAGKSDARTLGQVITKWVGSPPNAPAYIKDVTSRLGISADTPVDLTKPAQRLAISSAIMLHENGPASVFSGGAARGAPAAQTGAPAAAPPLGAQSGAEANSRNLSDELSKKWTDLNTQNQQAQGIISNLQNIKTLAAKAAVGPQSDRLNYVNGLLSLAGSEKATDAVTANDLLNKYSNQITARLSAGGMGTDAARTILQSAYPNAHMTPQAINEAADNLQGASQMVQAKTRLLAPLRNAGDATSYTNTETKFDQNADPRIFQYANIHDPVQRQAFARQLMQQDPKIVDKIKVLQGMGAF